MDQNSFSQAVKEFQEIYEKEFREKIDEKTAQEKAKKLLNLLKVVYKSEMQYDARRKNY
jgi:hypothetical protein